MKHTNKATIALIAFLLNLLLPITAGAAPVCTLEAMDTVAGLGTQVSITGCEAGLLTSLIVKSPLSPTYTQDIALDSSGNAITVIPSKHTVTAGAYQVSAAGQTGSFQVIPDRADEQESSLTVSPKSIQGNGQDSATVTVILRDRYGNPISGRPLTLLTSRVSDTTEARGSETDENGRLLWTVRAHETGVATLIPYDILGAKELKLRGALQVSGGKLQASLSDVAFGGDEAADLTSTVIDHFELTLPQGALKVQANELFSMKISAMNGGSLVRGYIGTLIVESSDSDAELPKKGEDPKSPDTGRVDVRAVDQGERNVPLAFMLRNRGPQRVTIYDKLDPTLRGEITLNVLRGGDSEQGTIVILDPPDRSHIKGHTVLLQGRAPSLVNLKVKGGKQTVDAESDEEGVFRVSVELNEDDHEVTLFVTSENNTYESEPLHLIVDTNAPKIGTVQIDPEEGKTEDSATIMVKTEPGLKSVTATIQDRISPLAFTGAVYIGRITAPSTPGTYDVTIVATDEVDNEVTVIVKWKVTPKEVARVTGVRAESQPQAVYLEWNPVESLPVREYKIYIALESDPGNALYSIATQKPVTSAVIKDLPLGETYLFSVTAIGEDGKESTERSDAAQASPIGIRFRAVSGADSLLLEWTKLPNLTLNHYILEYGTQIDTYSERRSIDGNATTTVLRDLLPGVEYFLKLTPVTVTGKALPELSSVTQATPNGTGFIAGPSEPVPTDLLPGPMHSGAPQPRIDTIPQTSNSGIPTPLIGASLVLAVIGAFVWRKKKKERQELLAFLSTMEQRYYS